MLGFIVRDRSWHTDMIFLFFIFLPVNNEVLSAWINIVT